MGGQHARARRAYEVLARRANSHALARALDRVGPDEEEGSSLELGELGVLWVAWMADGIGQGRQTRSGSSSSGPAAVLATMD
jgi:hypothetical protein